jgi:DNA-damage-inducible protein D
MPSTHPAIFQGRQVRKVLHNDEWFFSVVDVVAVLTESADASAYWRKLKQRLGIESGQPVTFCHGLKLVAEDGKMRVMDCANTQGLFRIIQSIPSPKAEPFKAWLAQVGAERVQEIENPELASQRAREIYKAKGYPEDWIEKRMRSIAIREELTDEWKGRGVREQMDFAILTAEISRATFGVTPSQHKSIKGLERQNLRDHMNDLELIFSMLGEAATTEITRAKDARGFSQSKEAAKEGGNVAGRARKELEQKSGRKVVTSENFLPEKKTRRIAKKD